ncbi:MAG: DNA internalization-related competence protein ComEC/Rec2 [Chloroflexi bacterium]|nr:DNA internalization-related competence protein ComEC/Rec2 [Chloroflexota bacterium]
MALVYLSCAWVIGVLIGSKLELSLPLVLFSLLLVLVLAVLRRYRKLLILSSLCILAIFAGAYRFQSSLPQDTLEPYLNQSVELRGLVTADPEVRDKTMHLRLSLEEMKESDGWREASGTVLLFVPRYSDYRYGDVLKVSGKLDTPPQFSDFDYRGYLAGQGIYATMLYPKIEVLATGQDFKLLEIVYSIRKEISQALEQVLPEPQASVAKGIVLGIREEITSSLKDAFAHSGLTHVLAISGVNLTIVTGILLAIGIWLFGRRHYIYIYLALGIIWLYASLTGLQPPVIRGAFMASLFLVAELVGRQRSVIVALPFAAAIMVAISPQILWDASFQLSFLSMSGLVFIYPHLRVVSARMTDSDQDSPLRAFASFILDSFAVTLAALLAVLPPVAYYFGIVAFASPLATLLALPVLPAIIVSGILAGVVGLVFLPLAQVIAWLVWLFISYLLAVVYAFAALYTQTGPVSASFIWGYYLVLGIALWLVSHRKTSAVLGNKAQTLLKAGAGKLDGLSSRFLKWVAVGLLVIAALTTVTAATMPDDRLHVSFLDVGQGDAILIQTPAHQGILIDGGPSAQAITNGLSQKIPFWDRTIDLIIPSHPDADHITGEVTVLERYEVKQALYPDLDVSSPIYNEWQRLVVSKGIKTTIARAGQQIELGRGATIEVINPLETQLKDTGYDDDNNGVVLRLSMGKVSFLFTGDIRQVAEDQLIVQRANLESTVLKVAHHGSNTSTSLEFLAAVSPQFAVVSAGKDNRYGHPHQEVMNRLRNMIGTDNIYLTYNNTTDKNSTIEFITDGERLWVKKR